MLHNDTVMLGHGSGGSMMKRIIDEVFLAAYGSEELRQGDDAAVLPAPAAGERLAFSTDSFVVTPHFFPGGDIGRLAICGTVTDVATSGARPLYLSCSFVLEEGFPLDDLRRICASMAECAAEAGVRLVTGDTKVVNRGHGDGIYINTSGIGVVPPGVKLGGARCRPGDAVLVTGTLGDHGITIMSCREGLSFAAPLESDAAPLNHLIAAVLAAAPATRCFRDPTRGGLASTLNELAAQAEVDIGVEEEADQADAALAAMRESPSGQDAALIGHVAEADLARGPKVLLRTAFGSTRILDMLVGEQLPRIC